MTKTTKIQLKSVVHFSCFGRVVPIKIRLKTIVPNLLIWKLIFFLNAVSTVLNSTSAKTELPTQHKLECQLSKNIFDLGHSNQPKNKMFLYIQKNSM